MKRLTRLQKNLLFAAVLLLAAVVLFWALRGRKQGEALVAVADFGDGVTETIPLDKDYDYLYDPQATDSSIPVCICCGRTVGHRYWKIRGDAICDLCMDSREEWREISYD